MKYLLLIHAGSVDEQGQAEGCDVSDWMAYDQQVKDAGIFVSGESLADLVTATTVSATAQATRLSPTARSPRPARCWAGST